MDKEKALSMLGLARRAGKLAMGHDMADKAIKDKKSKLIIIASDSSERIKNEFQKTIELQESKAEIVLPPITINEIHSACGYKAGIISVNDENFSKKIHELLN